MVIKDDNRFEGFDDFERRMLHAAEALGAVDVTVNEGAMCPRCGLIWHSGLSFTEDTVNVLVDAKGVEISAEDPLKAINIWLLLNKQKEPPLLIFC